MSISNFTIIKQCEHCSNMFEAQKRTTRFCSQRCASLNYKLRKRLELKKEIEIQVKQNITATPKVSALNLEMIKEKEFLSVKEVAVLFGCSKYTIYRMIKANDITAVNLSKNLTRIRRKDIERLFDKPTIEKVETIKIENCYLMDEIIEKYNVSRNTIYNYVGKHGIQRLKQDRITYYLKSDIDNLFNV